MGSRQIEQGEAGAAVRNNLRLLRRLREFTLAEVSNLMRARDRDICPTAISKIESGVRRVDVDDLVAFAKVYRVRPEQLLRPIRISMEEAR